MRSSACRRVQRLARLSPYSQPVQKAEKNSALTEAGQWEERDEDKEVFTKLKKNRLLHLPTSTLNVFPKMEIAHF